MPLPSHRSRTSTRTAALGTGRVKSREATSDLAPVFDKTSGPREAARHTAAALAKLRASGLKLTPQRIAVVRELMGDLSHPTAQELFERLRKEQPTMSFATVYNTLDALLGAGLCHARALSPGATRFDPNMIAHDHAVCDDCGAILDIAASELEPSPKARVIVPGFAVRAVEQVYRGSCARCAELGGT